MAEKLKRTRKNSYKQEVINEPITQMSETEMKMLAVYENAVNLMKKNTVQDYDFACLMFENIKGYKDADALFAKCKENIRVLKYDQAKLLMNENTLDSLEQARELLKDFDKNDVIVKECIQSIASLKYQDAIDLFNEEKYEEALAIFETIVNYQDVNDRIEECKEIIEEIKEEEERRKKPKIGLYLIVLILIALLCGGGYFGYKYFMSPKLVLQPMTIELGEEVKLDPKLFLDSKTKNIDTKKLMLDSELLDSEDCVYNKEDKTVVSKDKEYLDVGTYEVEIETKDGSLKGTTTITVEDTTKPNIICNETEFTYVIGDELFDLDSHFSCEDLSNPTLVINTDEVDWNTEGTYNIVVTATDSYGNKNEKTYKLHVEGNGSEDAQVEDTPTYYPTYDYSQSGTNPNGGQDDNTPATDNPGQESPDNDPGNDSPADDGQGGGAPELEPEPEPVYE